MNTRYAEEWKAAMERKPASLEEQDVAELIPSSSVPDESSILSSKWAFKVKTDGRFKARLVV